MSLMVCFNSKDLAGMTEPIEALAASRIWIVKLLNALNISADTLLCDLVPSASHVTDDEICKRLEGLTPIQKKAALDLLDTYIGNLPYLTNEE